MKQIRNIQQHFSIRKLTVGAASVLIGLSFLGFGTQTVRADVTNAASSESKTEQIESNQPNASTEETKSADDQSVKTNTTASDDSAASNADQQKVAVKENDNSITKTTDADKDVAKTVVDNKTTETQNETTPATNTSADNSAVQKTEGKSAETTPVVDNTSDANKNATETTKPAAPTTPVSDTDAKTPAKEGDAGKAEPIEATKDASKDAATDQGKDTEKTTLNIDKIKDGVADAKTLKEEKIVPASEEVALDDTSIRTKVTDLVNNLGDSTTIDVSGWNTSGVTDMSSLFANLPNVQHITGLETWDISNVTNMGHMFSNDPALISISDLSNWDTSKVNYMDNMFNGDKNLTTVKGLSHLNAHAATQNNMFDGSSLTPNGFDLNSDGLRSYISNHKNDESIDVSGLNTSNVDNMSNLFEDFKNLTTITGLDKWNTSNVINMGHMFAGDDKLTSLDLSNWDTSKVTHMDNMFNGDSSLTSVGDLSNWKSIQAVQDNMFDGSPVVPKGFDFNESALRGYLNNHRNDTSIDVSDFRTSHITNMSNLFSGFTNLKTVKGLNTWDTSNVTNMGNMFSGDDKLASVDLSGWDTSKVKYMDHMFNGDKSLTSVGDLSSWDAHNADQTDMFKDSPVIPKGFDFNNTGLRSCLTSHQNDTSIDVSDFRTSHVTDMSGLFQNFKNLTTVTGLDTWDTSNVTNMSNMFSGDNKLISVDLTGWKTSNVTNMNSMFSGDYKLTSVGDLSQWKTGNVTDMGSMFNGDNALQSTGNISGWNVSNVTNMDNMFNSTWALNENISGWNNNKASEKGMFDRSAVTVNVFDFNNDGLRSYLSNRKSATSIDVDGFKTTRVTNMKGLFQNFTNLEQITGLNSWDTSNVTDMSWMFDGDTKLTDLGDISHWDTSKVTDMRCMFQNIGCSSLDLSGWKTGNVVKMGWMFANTRTDITSAPLKEIKGLENWDVRNVQDFSHMFRSGNVHVNMGPFIPTGSLTNLDLSNWDTSSATDMQAMFWGQQNLTSVGNFAKWKLDHVTLTNNMFSYCKKLTFDSDAMANMANWNTSSDKNMSAMFHEMNNVKDLSFIQNWNVSNVKDMSYLFCDDYALTNVGDLSNWNTHNVGTDSGPNYSFAMMFAGCESLKEIKGIEHWDFTNAHSMRGMFTDTPVLNRVDLSQATKPIDLPIAASMFEGSGATYINLSGWDLSKLQQFLDNGMLPSASSANSAFMVLASWSTLRGGQDMFANLRRPAEIVLTGATLPAGENAFQVSDFRGNQPIVVFSDDSALSALNGQHWTDGNGNDVTGRQNSDYLTVNDGTRTTIVPMDFVYKDQAALTAALAQKLSPFGDVVRTSTRVDGQNIDPDSLTALQDVTGIYGPKKTTPSNPDNTPDDNNDNHGNPSDNNDNHSNEPGDQPNNTNPKGEDNTKEPNDSNNQTTDTKPHAEKPATSKKHKAAAPVKGEKNTAKKNGKTSTVRPHAAIAPNAQTLPAGQHVNSKGQILNAKGQVVGHVDKNAQAVLPQTGEKTTPLAWLGLGLASLAAIFGLAGDRKRG